MHSRNEYRKQCLKFFCTQHFQLVDSFFYYLAFSVPFAYLPDVNFIFTLIITESVHNIYTVYHSWIFTEDYEQSYHASLFEKKKKKEEKNPIFQAKSTTENDTFFIFEDKIASFKKSLKLHR